MNGLFRLVCASVLTPCSAVMSLYRQVDVVELHVMSSFNFIAQLHNTDARQKFLVLEILHMGYDRACMNLCITVV